MSCLELRRQKEMELEVMLGNIKNWDGMVWIELLIDICILFYNSISI